MENFIKFMHKIFSLILPNKAKINTYKKRNISLPRTHRYIGRTGRPLLPMHVCFMAPFALELGPQKGHRLTYLAGVSR